jgi:hypothetical protein
MKRSALLKPALLAAASIFAFATASAPVLAQGEFTLNSRLRWESVDQDGFANEAQAVTLRTRFGYQSENFDGLTFLIEGENVLHLADDFNDTINGLPGYPVVADPEETELNRLQLTAELSDTTTAIVGRQRIILGDARYVGNVGFRQNEQTFDAVVLRNTSVENLTVTYAYLDRVHRIFGDDHPAGELSMNTHTLWGALATDAGTFTGFALLADVDAISGWSTSTYGVNWKGSFGEEGGPSFGYMFEWAHQSDYADNTANFDLNMFRAEASVSQNGLGAAIGIESLEGNGSRGFITPLATLHKFQGWADVFLGTPANGIRDVYVRGSVNISEPPFGTGMNAALVFHDYESETGSQDLGSEFDAVLTSRINEHFSAQLKAAFYNGASGGPGDRDKIWFAITYNR